MVELHQQRLVLLPAYFATLPRLTFGVRPVPAEMAEGYTTARYWQGSPDQGIAGGYMVNTSHLDQRPLYELPALTDARRVLRPGGALVVWSAAESAALEESLRSVFPDVAAERRDVRLQDRDEHYWLYVARA